MVCASGDKPTGLRRYLGIGGSWKRHLRRQIWWMGGSQLPDVQQIVMRAGNSFVEHPPSWKRESDGCRPSGVRIPPAQERAGDDRLGDGFLHYATRGWNACAPLGFNWRRLPCPDHFSTEGRSLSSLSLIHISEPTRL